MLEAARGQWWRDDVCLICHSSIVCRHPVKRYGEQSVISVVLDIFSAVDCSGDVEEPVGLVYVPAWPAKEGSWWVRRSWHEPGRRPRKRFSME